MFEPIRVVNNFNGNLCFSAKITETDNPYIFECVRENATIKYAKSTSSLFLSDVIVRNEASYLFADESNVIRKFEGGAIVNFVVAAVEIDKFRTTSDGVITYSNGVITKLSSDYLSVIWTYTLPAEWVDVEHILNVRVSDGKAIYSNRTNMIVLRDDGSEYEFLNHLTFDGDSYLRSTMDGQFNPSHTFARLRWVSSPDILQSSSSSSSSGGYSSSSSSSSGGYSSSSSSSSGGYSSSSSSSSSSGGYSSSSSSSSNSSGGYSSSSSSSSGGYSSSSSSSSGGYSSSSSSSSGGYSSSSSSSSILI